MIKSLFFTIALAICWTTCLNAAPVKIDYAPKAWPAGTKCTVITGKLLTGYDLPPIMDANAGSFTGFETLQGAEVRISLKKKTHIGLLGVVQGGWGNWCHPNVIRIDLSSGKSINHDLDLNPGKVQTVAIDVDVDWLTITVEKCYSDGLMPWGGFAEISPVVIASCKTTFENSPADSNTTSLRLVLTRDTPGPALVTLATPDGNKYEHTFSVVKPGGEVFTIKLADFKASKENFLPMMPARLSEITAADPQNKHYVDMQMQVLPSPAGKAQWKPLAKLNIQHKFVDGKKWTEGLSATSTGRFGNSLYNGLLTETVDDFWFNAYTSRPGGIYDRDIFDITIPGINDKQIIAKESTGYTPMPGKVKPTKFIKQNVELSWTHVVWKREFAKGLKFTYRYSSLAPGFLIETNAKELTISSRGGGVMPHRSGAPNESEDQFVNQSSKVKKYGPAQILVPSSNGNVVVVNKPIDMKRPAEPWIVMLWGLGNTDSTLWGDRAVAVLITFDKIPAIKWTSSGITLSNPSGLKTIGVSTAFYGLLGDEWNQKTVAVRSRFLARMLHTYPLKCREWYRRDGQNILVRNEFSYYRWGNKNWQMPDYSPVPTLLAWGTRTVGWPKFPTAKDTGILTKFGPYLTCPGSVLTYSLTDWPIKHVGFPKTSDKLDLQNHFDASVASRYSKPYNKTEYYVWQPTLYTDWPGTMLDYSICSQPTRRIINQRAYDGIISAFNPRVWFDRKELYTGKVYRAAGWFDSKVKPAMIGDANSSAGTALYSLYVYGKYSGDWGTVRKLWPRAVDIERYLEVINDWAVPASSSREAANYDDIDMSTITYGGLCGYQRMAELFGTPEQAQRAAYMRAKMGTGTLLRLRFQDYLDPEHMVPGLFCQGFGEEGASLEVLKDNFFIKDHLGMLLAWCAQDSAIYNYFMDAAGKDFCSKYQSELVEKGLPNWREMGGNQDKLLNHIAQRAWLPDWPQDDLWNSWNAYAKYFNGDPGGSEGALSLLLGRNTPYLVNWEPAALISCKWENNTLYAHLSASQKCLVSVSDGAINSSFDKQVVSVICDNKEIPFSRKAGLVSISLTAGKHDVMWRYGK